MKTRFTAFDYTVTVSRKNRYLVVSSPEFGYQIASHCLEMGKANPEAIGNAIIQVIINIGHKLQELDKIGSPHPMPKTRHALLKRDVVSAKDAAKILGVCRATLRRMAYSGQLHYQRTPGGHLRFSLDAISDFLMGQPSPAPLSPAPSPAGAA